jgi:hypothetical protein
LHARFSVECILGQVVSRIAVLTAEHKAFKINPSFDD